MSKKLEHEIVFEYYSNENYIMKNIYKGTKQKDQLICPMGHEIEMLFDNFKKGVRCGKCFGNTKLSHKYVFDYYLSKKYKMKSIYKNCETKDILVCPNNHKIKLSFKDFKSGTRCRYCSYKSISTKLSLSHTEVFEYYKQENYIMHNIYNGCMSKDNLTCPVGHKIKMRFNDFKSGNRCGSCSCGINHPRYNPNREEISLNSRLRKKQNKKWLIKYMKDDPNYEKFLLNPKDYVVDHIIPVSLFCRLFTKYNLDEDLVKDIINKRYNLQLLTIEENSEKRDKGSSLFEATQYLINNGIPFETFLEENIV